MGSENTKEMFKSESMTSRKSLRPLKFHQMHGSNVILRKKETVAYRSNGFNCGIVFTNRPVMILEPILIQINETATNWSGALRIGFTINDPKTMKSKVPAHSCPDLVSIPGNWAKALPELVNNTDYLLTFYVDANGDVYYGIDDKEKRFLLSGVNTTEKLWGIIDVYGNTVEVELIGAELSDSEEEQLTSPNLTFNQVHGRTVTLKDNRTVASRKSSLTNFSYVFSGRPMTLDEKVVIQVFEVDVANTGSLEYGVTSCDPSILNPTTLPADTEDLLDWPDYWVFKSDSCHYGLKDIIIFSITSQGQFMVMKNGTSVSSTLHVDVSQPLWLFLKLSGFISSVCLKASSTSEYADIMKCLDVSIPPETLKDKGKNTNSAGSSGEPPSSDCIICSENKVNCALYRCGHMCMCYECAKSYWRSNTHFQCPICRSTIQDIIKVYT